VTDNEAATAFIAFVLGARGQAILAAAGFGAA
jgi:ABC-type molybdate transport system substrate-binding protein